MNDDRVVWNSSQHEYGVERFYGTGAENYKEYHGGFLNFGWWENTDDYLIAAQALVHKMGVLLGINDQSHLLDVACGMAPQDVYLHKNFGAQIDAVDVTWKHVKIARERITKEELGDSIQIHHASATNVPFEDAYFSHVLSIEGPEHFDTREHFFRESFRVLKPGGVFAVSDYTLKRHPRKLWERFIVKAAQKLWHVPDANVYDPSVYRQKMEAVGFSNISIEEVGKHVIPGYFLLNLKKTSLKEMRKIRGWFAAYGGIVIDYLMYKSFEKGLIEYVLVRAEKPVESIHKYHADYVTKQ